MPKQEDASFNSHDIEFGLVPDAMFDDMQLSRKHNVENYLSRLTMNERDIVNMFAANMQPDKPLAPVSAIIPIAAHQEASNIIPALSQYAKQQTEEPFSIVLYPNMPDDGDLGKALKTIDEIEEAKAMFPHLDIRSTELHINENPQIGQLRRDVWGATILLAYVQGAFDESDEFMGVNHDIDVMYMSPHYMRRIQEYRDRIRDRRKNHGITRDIPLKTMSTQMRHGFDTQFPNSSRVVGWVDFAHRQARDASAYDAGLVVPFAHYAQSGGFDGSRSIYETAPLRNSGETIQKIPGTAIHSSPRRYIERLRDHEISEIWSDGSFDAHNAYREDNGGGDISTARKESLVHASLEAHVPYFFLPEFQSYNRTIDRLNGIVPEESILRHVRRLEPRKRLAMKVLREYVGSPKLAGIVDASYDIRAIARNHRRALKLVETRDVVQ